MNHSSNRRPDGRANVAATLELLAARFPRLARYASRNRVVAITTGSAAAENLIEARQAFARSRAKLAALRARGQK